MSGNELRKIGLVLGGKTFSWDCAADRAVVSGGNGRAIWSGSLLPSFELSIADGTTIYADSRAVGVNAMTNGDWSMELDIGDGLGEGKLVGSVEPWGIRFSRLSVRWHRDTSIIALYFGARRMSELEMRKAPRTDRPFWPDWSSEGYCIPCASSSPTKSFWRSWDMGDAVLPLGSFGDAMGTPYAAAFPRPLYAAAMGGTDGYVCFGPGEVPDAALTLKLQAATACLQYLYREDLWGAPDPLQREWLEPLRLSWGDSGFEAYDRLYRSFPTAAPKSPRHLRSFLCTWGDFKEGLYNLREYANRASAASPADMIILDDGWETFNGSGQPNYDLFPDFDSDLEAIREKGYGVAFWQSLCWVDRPEEVGLTDEDLLCGIDGKPRLWAWSGNPLAEGRTYHYCADPSSERSRRFIEDRTRRIVSRYRPAALKLDFGYGVPGPDACAPRNPALRGERLNAELLRIIASAAREIDSDITIIYYGVHPLLHEHADLISLDDLGDAGDSPAYETAGHNQRCLWAALAAGHGMAINTSTGYYWDTLESILLDTAVVGVNGLTLGRTDRLGQTWTEARLNRWHALYHWHRRSCGWKPLWLNADLGGMDGEPTIRSWGRVETVYGEEKVTAVALRGDVGGEVASYSELPGFAFSGDWALISQDDQDIRESGRLACIPFKAGRIELVREYSSAEVYRLVNGRMELAEIKGSGLSISVTEEELSRIAGFIVIG